MAVRTIKGILQRRHTEQGEPSHSLTGEGHRRGEESGMECTPHSRQFLFRTPEDTLPPPANGACG